MQTLIITKTFSNGRIQISSKPLPRGSSITQIISVLDYEVAIGLLYGYDIEIIRSEK